MLPVAVSAGLLRGGYGLGAAGYAMAFLVGPLAGLVLFGGVLADRFTARRMMIFADLSNLTAHALLAFLFFHGIDHLWQLYAVLVLAGTANAMFQPGASSTVPLVARDVQGANGVLRTSEALTGAGRPGAGRRPGRAREHRLGDADLRRRLRDQRVLPVLCSGSAWCLPRRPQRGRCGATWWSAGTSSAPAAGSGA